MKHRFVYLALFLITLLSVSCSEMPLLDDLVADLRDNPADPDSIAPASWKVAGSAAVASGTGANVSLAIGSDGVPYVAFAQTTWVRVRKLEGDTWTLVGTGDINSTMDITDLDVAVRGTVPYVVYKPTTFTPECKYLSGADWGNVGPTLLSTQTSISFSDPSMLLTPTEVFIAYNDTGIGYVVRHDGAVWSPDDFIDGTGDPEAIDLAYYDNEPFVSFINNYAGVNRAVSVRTPMTAVWPPAGWNYLFSDGQPGITGLNQEESGIVFSVGIPYVASMITGTIRVIKNTALDSWTLAGTNPVAQNGFKLKMATDPDGVVYIAYQDGDNDYKMTVKKLVGSTWEVVGQVGFSGTVGDSLDFAILPVDGKLYIAYVNQNNTNQVQVMSYGD